MSFEVIEIIVAVIAFAGLIYLFVSHKIDEKHMESIDEFLDHFDDGEGDVSRLVYYARLAVRAVEQLVKSGIIPKENSARLEAASDMVINMIKTDGASRDYVNIDTKTIENIIESEVYSMNNEKE